MQNHNIHKQIKYMPAHLGSQLSNEKYPHNGLVATVLDHQSTHQLGVGKGQPLKPAKV